MEELKKYLQELQNEGVIHQEVNKHIIFLVKKLLIADKKMNADDEAQDFNTFGKNKI